MIINPRFLTIDEVLYFHQQEILYSGGSLKLRDRGALEAAIEAPKVSFDGQFLMDIFEMAATYANSLCFNHPFFDGNKRTAVLSSLSFLFFNGYEYSENYDEELADTILALVTHKISKNDLAAYFKKQSRLLT
jgi:death-on-curing protein